MKDNICVFQQIVAASGLTEEVVLKRLRKIIGSQWSVIYDLEL